MDCILIPKLQRVRADSYLCAVDHVLVLRPLGASHEVAYFACHLMLSLAGLWCAYYVLTHAVMPAWARVVTFVVVAVAGFAPYMGVNGVLLRYLFPLAALLAGHRAVTWSLSKRNYLAAWGGAVVSVLLLLVANILLSPEAGVSFALAWLSYAALSLYREARILAVFLIAVVGAASLGWLFLPVDDYGTLLRFSQGANNLPLLPAPHLLLYITTLLLLVPPLLAVGVRKWRSNGQGDAAICGALGSLCVVMAPGALGPVRPTSCFVIWNGSLNVAHDPTGECFARSLRDVCCRIRQRVHCAHRDDKPACFLWILRRHCCRILSRRLSKRCVQRWVLSTSRQLHCRRWIAIRGSAFRTRAWRSGGGKIRNYPRQAGAGILCRHCRRV